MKKIKLLSVILLLSQAGMIFGQKQLHDSLLHYINIAMQQSPLVLQKYHNYKASLHRIPQVASLPDPELNMGIFLEPMEIVSGRQYADIQLMQMFPWFGTLKYARDEMSLMAKAEFESLRDAKLQISYDLQIKWYDLYKNQRNIILVQQNIDLLNSIEKLALIKYKTSGSGFSAKTQSSSSSTKSTGESTAPNMGGGMIGMSSTTNVTTNAGMSMPGQGITTDALGLSAVLRLQMEKAELQNSLESLFSRKKTLTAGFNAILDRNAEIPVFVPDSIAGNAETIALLSSDIPSDIPMLEMIRYESESLTAKKEMQKRMGYPMLGAGVSYSVIGKSDMSMSDPEMNGKDMFMPMLTISLPIYRSKYKAMRSETEALTAASKSKFRETYNLIQTAYYEAVEQYQNNLRQLTLYRQQVVTLQKILDLSVREFSVSGKGLSEILRFRQELFDFELKIEETQSDLNTSIALIDRLTNKSDFSNHIKE